MNYYCLHYHFIQFIPCFRNFHFFAFMKLEFTVILISIILLLIIHLCAIIIDELYFAFPVAIASHHRFLLTISQYFFYYPKKKIFSLLFAYFELLF